MLYKKKSKIHGMGLFTDSPIKKGTYIGMFKTTKAKYFTKFSIHSKKGWRRAICDLKYMNHSEKPNVEVTDDLKVWAIRNIKPGEELVWTYGGWE